MGNEEKKLDNLITLTRRTGFGHLICYVLQEAKDSDKNINQIKQEAFKWIEKLLPMEDDKC